MYQRLMSTSRRIDADLWHSLEPRKVYYPEIEYITYDVKELGGPGTISPHVDNDSMVSMLIMLSDPSDFQGGVNCFGLDPDWDDDATERRVQLRLGDAVF